MLVALGAVALLGAGSLPAVALPPAGGDGGDTGGSIDRSEDCVLDAVTSVSVSKATVGLRGTVRVDWSFHTDPGCNVTVTIVGSGFDTTRLADSGSRTVEVSHVLGWQTWRMHLGAAGGVSSDPASAGTTVVTSPSPPLTVAANADGRLELLRTDSGDHISRRSQNSPGSTDFSPYFGVDGYLTSVAARRTTNGALEVEVLGTNEKGELWTHRQLGPGAGAWSDWVRNPYDPTLASVAASDRLIAATTPSGRVYVEVVAPYAGSWSLLPDSGPPLADIAVVENADGRSEIFGVGFDDTIWVRWQTSPGSGSWSDAVQLDGRLHSIAAARYPDGRLQIFGANSQGQIWARLQAAPNQPAAWAPSWVQFPGSLDHVAAATDGNGAVDVYGVNYLGQYYHQKSTDGVTFSGWYGLDEVLASRTISPPQQISVALHPGGADITWQDESNNETGFIVQYRSVNTSYWGVWRLVDTVTTPGYGDGYLVGPTGFSRSGGYCFRVIAYNHNDSAASGETCADVPSPPPPTTPPATPPPTSPPSTDGIRRVFLGNCESDQHAVVFFLRDATLNQPFTQKNIVEYQGTSSGACNPAPGSFTEMSFTPVNGHTYQLVATDSQRGSCLSHLDDPDTGGCRVLEPFAFVGNPNGHTLLAPINLPFQVQS